MSAASNRKKRHSSTRGSNIPSWVWLFTGVVLGAFIMFLIHLSDTDTHQAIPVSPKEDTKNKTPSTKDIKFDFYEILKNNKVDVGPTEPTQSASNTATVQTDYLLQVASFKSMQDAERLRAELILLNLSAITEIAKVRDGETWHRVIVGPFTSRSKLASARDTLLSNNHEALVLKRAAEK